MRAILLLCGVIGGAGCAQVDPGKTGNDARPCFDGQVRCGDECVRLESDPDNCGACGNQCDICQNRQCVTECTGGAINCDGKCIDPNTDEDYCGAQDPCTGAGQGEQCMADEICMNGQCECASGLTDCNGQCVDLMTDDNNCGTCGLQCTGCSGGICPGQQIWSEMFTMGVKSEAQCTSYRNFFQTRSGSYQSITMFGSNDVAGITCSEPSKVSQIINGIKNETEFHLTCSGHVWSQCLRSKNTSNEFPELWIDAPSLCDPYNCPDPGYIVRPCTQYTSWGGVNTFTCTTQSVSQTMGLRLRQ